MNKITLTTCLLILSGQLAIAQQWKNTTRLEAKVTKANDKFGTSLAINATNSFVGASLDDEAISNGGAVYVYDGNLKFTEKLFPSTPMKSAYFGNSMTANDKHLVVGAYYGKHDVATTKKEGLVYLFAKDASNKWKETKILKQENGNSYDLFGRDVAISGDYILATANGEDEGERSSGAAYIFFKDQGGADSWGQQAKLKAKDIQKNAYFGWSGDLSGDYAIVGAYKFDAPGVTDAGAAYIFKRNGTNWEEQVKLVPTNTQSDDLVGYDVAIAGDYAVISAPNAVVDGVSRAGKVYVYKKNASDTWELNTSLTAPNPTVNETFGHKVAIEGKRLIISSKGNQNRKGRVFVFTLANKEWGIAKELTKTTPVAEDNYGVSVALRGERTLIGSDEGTDRVGAVYAYEEYLRFEEVTAGISNFFYASLDWGDFDNDGYKDVIVSGGIDTTGDHSADQSAVKLFRNKQDGTFEEVVTPMYGLHLGAVKFVDVDNDADLDVVICGQNYADITKYYLTVYENDGAKFKKKQDLDGLIYASLSFADIDNNGTLDMLVTGASQAHGTAAQKAFVYTNEKGMFKKSSIALPGVQNGQAEFADIDADGDMDILIMGTDKDDKYILKTFSNDAATFTEKQSLPGMYLGGLAFGDFNADGYPDFAVMGDDTNDDYAALIYKNTKGTFAEYKKLKGVDSSSGTTPVAWADYDNDGDLDLLLAGTDEDYNDVSLTYKNNNGKFHLTNEGIQGLGGNVSLGWADIDNDNDVDALVSGWYTDKKGNYTSGTLLHKNTTVKANLAPSAPTNLTTTTAGNAVTFAWDAATDDTTNSNGLFYMLQVGTTKGAHDVAYYPVYGTTWTLKGIGSGPFYWSLTTVDAAYVQSSVAEGTSVTLGTDKVEKEAANVLVYPNPIQEEAKVTLPKHLTNARWSVYDINGRRVLAAQKMTSNGVVNMAALTSGTYVLKITTANAVVTKKIVKY